MCKKFEKIMKKNNEVFADNYCRQKLKTKNDGINRYKISTWPDLESLYKFSTQIIFQQFNSLLQNTQFN